MKSSRSRPKHNSGPDHPDANVLGEDGGRLRAIFDAARSISLIMTDLAGTEAHILEFSPGAERIFGYRRDEVIGRPAAILHVPEEVAKFPKTIQMLREGRADVSGECMLVRKGGERFPAHLTLHPIFDAQGEVMATLGVTIDITEQKRAQQALRESEERFRLLFENVHDIVASLDADLRLRSVSPSVETALGYKPEELVGHRLGELHILAPRSIRAALADVQRILSGEVVRSSVYEFIARNGSRRFGEASGAPLFRDGRVTAIVAVVRDITERRRLEAELVQSSEAERHRLGLELHDGLGQHLTGVAFLCKALARSLAEAYPRAATEAGTIAELVNQGGELARSLAMGLCPVGVEAGGLASALKDFAARTRLRHRVNCEFRGRKGAAVRDNATATHLYRIAQEAVTNALKHGKAKAIRIRLEKEDHQVVLRIEDDGVGLPEQPRKGGGMGLHLMQYRADIIGALFDIRRGADGGTVVTCSLPQWKGG